MLQHPGSQFFWTRSWWGGKLTFYALRGKGSAFLAQHAPGPALQGGPKIATLCTPYITFIFFQYQNKENI